MQTNLGDDHLIYLFNHIHFVTAHKHPLNIKGGQPNKIQQKHGIYSIENQFD